MIHEKHIVWPEIRPQYSFMAKGEKVTIKRGEFLNKNLKWIWEWDDHYFSLKEN